MLLQRNLSKRATCGPVMTDLTERWLRYTVKVNCNGLVLCSLDPWEAVCFREVATFIQWTDRFHFMLCAYVLCVYLVIGMFHCIYIICIYVLCVVLLLCTYTLSSSHYVCLNNVHVSVCPLLYVVMHPSLQEFPVVSLMSSKVMVVWSLDYGHTPAQLL